MAPRAQPACDRSVWPDLPGVMPRLIRTHEWRTTPLGGMEGWPQALRTCVELMLQSRQPSSVCWGHSLITLYNDACLPLLGSRHPASLGKPYPEVWPNSWEDLKPSVEAALAGEPQHLVGEPIPRTGEGDPASWYTWSWTPLRDEQGAIAGLFCSATQTTFQIADRQLRTVLENAREGVFMQDIKSQRTAYISPVLAELTGFSLEELYAMSEREWLHRIHPEDMPEAREHIEKIASGAWREGTADMRWRIKAGSYRWLRISRRLVRDPGGRPLAVVGVCGDITEQKQAEADLRASEARLHLALESAKMGTWEWNLKTNRSIWNAKLFDLMGIPEATESTGDLFFSVVHPDDLRDMRASVMDVLASGREWRAEFRIRRPDGQIRWLAGVGQVFRDPDGTPRTMMGINYDITDQREAGAALRESEARLRALQEELIHVGRVSELSQVSAGIAHELNQPLAAMLNYASTAKRMIDNRDDKSLASAQKFIAKAGEQAERAGEIIRRMRDFVEKRQTHRTREHINQIIRDALALGLIGAKAAGVVFRYNCGSGLPTIIVDRVQIQQVMVNLLRNAIDALATSDIRELIVTTAACEGGVEVSVTDSGCGIPEHILGKLFQPFVTTKPGGMGIGLAISLSIIEAHGGRLAVEAREGGGTVFRFTLPAEG